jgi:hypothetical protein
MWIYMIAAFLLIVGIVGGIAGGGMFTVVLVPLAGIIVVTGFIYQTWSRASQGSSGIDTDAHPSTNRPLPHKLRENSGHAPNSPERLADTRRAEQ